MKMKPERHLPFRFHSALASGFCTGRVLPLCACRARECREDSISSKKTPEDVLCRKYSSGGV